MSLRTVAVLATGGTISAAADPGETTNYTDGVFDVKALTDSVPGLTEVADVRGENFCNRSSTDMTRDLWRQLARRITELAASDVDGIVITHGTDTLEEVAYFLTLACATDKPIVVTGAMRPATANSADGPLNMYQAVVTAASPDSPGRGAVVVFQDSIYAARDVQKVSSFKVDAFGGREYGLLGYVRDKRTHYLYRSEKRHTAASEFATASVPDLPAVPIVCFSQDIPATIVDFYAENFPGFILAGAGGAAIGVEWRRSLKRATDAGVVIVRSTRTLNGLTDYHFEMDGETGTIPALSLPPQKASVLLSLALAHQRERHDIRRIFEQY